MELLPDSMWVEGSCIAGVGVRHRVPKRVISGRLRERLATIYGLVSDGLLRYGIRGMVRRRHVVDKPVEEVDAVVCR